MKQLSFLTLIAVVLLVAPLGFVSASEVQAGKNVSVMPSEVLLDNAYFFGEQVTISAPSEKDLTALGGILTLNAPVFGDALLLGGTLTILGDIAGDLRTAGGDITISKSVGGDLLVVGGSVTILPSVTISGDLIVLGGTVNIEGAVEGSVRVYGGSVVFNSTVVGSVFIQAGDTVFFGSNTVLKNTLAYSAPQEAVVEDGARLGEQVVFSASSQEKGFQEYLEDKNLIGVVLLIFGFLVMVEFLGILIAALVITFAFKTFSLRLSENVIQHFWKMASIGFIATVSVPVAILLLSITLVGLYLGFILGALYLLMLLVAGVYMCIFAGAFLSKWIKKQTIVNWQWTIVGTIAVFLVLLVPVVGWIAIMLLYFASVGTIVMSLKSHVQVTRQSP